VDLYLGRPGTLLTRLRSPRPGVDRSPNGGEQVTQLLGGGYAVDRAPSPARTWEFTWTWDDDTYHVLQAFYRRQFGPGPFALIDPGQINYLLPNQASPGSVSGDAAGFRVVAGSGEAVTASTALIYQGTASLVWTLPAAPTGNILTFEAPAPLLGWPVASTTWSLSVRVRLGAGDTAVDVLPALRWLTPAGTHVAQNNGATVTVGPSAWSLLTVSMPPAVGGVLLEPRLQVTAGTVTSPATVHVGQAQLQIGPVSDWRPGEGPALVGFTGLSDVAQMTLDNEQRHDVKARFVELATEV
jgi:hypothetical protein